MRIQTFKLERQFALYKAKAKYMLSQTSCEGCSMQEILKTVLVREMSELLILGAVIVLRALLSFLIHFELRATRHEEAEESAENESH